MGNAAPTPIRPEREITVTVSPLFMFGGEVCIVSADALIVGLDTLIMLGFLTGEQGWFIIRELGIDLEHPGSQGVDSGQAIDLIHFCRDPKRWGHYERSDPRSDPDR